MARVGRERKQNKGTKRHATTLCSLIIYSVFVYNTNWNRERKEKKEDLRKKKKSLYIFYCFFFDGFVLEWDSRKKEKIVTQKRNDPDCVCIVDRRKKIFFVFWVSLGETLFEHALKIQG